MSTQNFAGAPPFANTGQTAAPAPPTAAPPTPPVQEAVQNPQAAAPVQKAKRPQPATPGNALQFITANIKTMSYQEMASAMSTPDNVLEARDVNNIIQRIKKMLRDGAGKDGYGTRQVTSKKTGKTQTKADYTQPLNEKAQKVETWITANLARPADAKVGAPGGARKESAMNQALQGDINDILASL